MKTLLFIRTRPLESNTSSSIRAISTIELLSKCGYEITVLTTNAGLSPEEYKDYQYVSKMIRIPVSGTYETVRKVKSGKNSLKKGLKTRLVLTIKNIYRKFVVIDPLKSVTTSLFKVSNELASKYDVIASCSDPKSSHILADKVIRSGVKYNKYVQFWGDPLFHDISRRYYVPKAFVWRSESRLIRMADIVYYVSPFTLESQKRTFPKYAERMKCLLPAYQNERIYMPVQKVKRIGYFGDYNTSIRNLAPLYEAVLNTGFQLEIYGDSDLNLKPTLNVSVNGRISRDEVAKAEGETDLLVCLCNSSGNQIPGKLYQYASTNKPILVINDGIIDLSVCFGKFNRFIFCDNNVESIRKALTMVSSLSFEDIKPLREFSVEAQVQHTKNEIEG